MHKKTRKDRPRLLAFLVFHVEKMREFSTTTALHMVDDIRHSLTKQNRDIVRNC